MATNHDAQSNGGDGEIMDEFRKIAGHEMDRLHDEAVAGVKNFAGLCATYFKELRTQGIGRTEALQMTLKLITEIAGGNKNDTSS